MIQKATREGNYVDVSDPVVMALRPVVSVHMITYNHGPYLAEAIEGVIAQNTDFPIELIIGEDCSTDNTREIALDYQRRYPHIIRVIYSDHNVGMLENDRRVLEACRGELVAFCEGDDYWINPDKLREQVDVLTRFKHIDITFHSCYFKYEKQGKKVLAAVHSPTDKVFTLSTVIAGSGDFMPSASLLVRRSLLMSVQDWFDATMPPVGDYFIQVFGSRRGGAYYLNKPMSVYRKEVEVSWSETTEKKIDALVEFEKNFLFALIQLERAIPGQEEAIKHQIVSHYARRFTTATNDNYMMISKLMLPVLDYLYKPEAGNVKFIGTRLPEWKYLSKLAHDSGNVKCMTDSECGVFWQFLRVISSFFEYCASILKVININQSHLSECEWAIAKWKVKEQGSYLAARWKRFCRLIIGNIGWFYMRVHQL